MPKKKRASSAGAKKAKKAKSSACSFGFSFEADDFGAAGPGAKYRDELAATAKAIACGGKGILAADESNGTIGKRFAPIGVLPTVSTASSGVAERIC